MLTAASAETEGSKLAGTNGVSDRAIADLNIAAASRIVQNPVGGVEGGLIADPLSGRSSAVVVGLVTVTLLRPFNV